MLPSKHLFVHHVRWLRKAAKEAGLEVLVELDSMVAYLRKDERHWVLFPKFLTEVDGHNRYLPTLPETPMTFAGWMPAPNAGWPAVHDKLEFKRAAAQLGLRVPPTSFDASGALTDVVVKSSAGSFGEEVHGPYRSSRERPLRRDAGEYYEPFIEGEIVKAWYLGSQAIVLECDTPPAIEGDGVSTLRQLVEHRARGAGVSDARMPTLVAHCADMLRYDGASLDDVPARGVAHRVEFRYGTDLMTESDRRQFDLRVDDAGEWQLLKAAAPLLASLVPQALRAEAVFAVDALRDRDGNIWLLEMNANPAVHPLAYPAIVAAMLADIPPIRAATAASQTLPA